MQLLAILLPLFLAMVDARGFLHTSLDIQGRAIFLRDGPKRVMYVVDGDPQSGGWTEWLNRDSPDPRQGSTGDYEWVLQSIYGEMFFGDCLIPCAADDITAMEVDILGTDQDEDFIKTCMDLEEDAFSPQTGFYCMNNMQRKDASKCPGTERCHALMTSDCHCPDARVRYYCATPAEEQQKYCDQVEENFQGGGIFRQLKRMLRGRKRSMTSTLKAYALKYLP
ncbi:hypothetical protein CAPTEDRAFT_219431 [Capitella teleta]|uniref:Uncharacterized protein n=1 Tax=Capitella teleta TaxID=283909 RepID=R7VAT4_CAPTE|nr:hypothetical protein CAPTEDRAFT_219431 [Capitella teleta]|eukprot:ELU15642.1 hypothetical protein CAPTEDRAFT_219431 [Capitella teleta]